MSENEACSDLCRDRLRQIPPAEPEVFAVIQLTLHGFYIPLIIDLMFLR